MFKYRSDDAISELLSFLTATANFLFHGILLDY